jgi:hypothetical protein
MLDCWHELASGGCIRAELVRDNPSWKAALLLQQTLQQARGGLGIAACLDDLIEHIAILIDSSPEPVLLAGDGDHDLIKVPHVATLGVLRLRRRA